MKLDKTFLRSKVARRVFALFIICALLPITLLAIVSFSHVSSQLNEQTKKRLHRESKAVGMSIYERLLFLEADMKLIASKMGPRPGRAGKTMPASLGEDLGKRFKGLARVNDAGHYSRLLGRIQMPSDPTPAQQRHLKSGKSLVSLEHQSGLPPQIFMRRMLDPQRPDSGVLLGEVLASYLWALDDQATLPARTEMCVLGDSRKVLVCSFEGPVTFVEDVAFHMANSPSAYIEWEHGGEPYLAGFWSLPLKFRFHAPTWTVVLSEPKAFALAPMSSFKYAFSLVILLSVLVVSLLSVSQIRKSLVPLEKLREGTQRIARGDFTSRVAITSGDEFEELGDSFNAMVGQLGRQFDTLATISEIDRAVLSALETNTIVGTVLDRVGEIFPCDLLGVSLLDAEVADAAWTYLRDREAGGGMIVEGVELLPQDVQRLHDHPGHLFVAEQDMPQFLAPLGKRGMKAFLILSLFRARELSGFITMAYRKQPEHSEEDLVQARQVADQVAAALANARDVAERKRTEGLLQESNQQLKDALAELKSTQKQMVQQERLRALGQMASGIAHDFNNTLSPIVGFSELLLLNPKSLEDTGKVKEHLRIINTAARDASKVVSRLRDFYRPRVQEDISGSVDLNKLVPETIRLTQPKWKDQALTNGITVEVETELGEVKPIAGNESELREVLTNLIFNAVDAMAESGTIALKTRMDGDQVVLEVQDSGMGMTEEVRQRCLEPFFSTKGDRGTGLGLAMVYGIIQRQQGTIDIESRPGKGTSFLIRLPVAGRQMAEGQAVRGTKIAERLHVLVADDDPLVRRVTTEYLTSLGYTVQTAAGGAEALEHFKGGRFDLVITDQGMPGVSGEQLASAVKQQDTQTPVIILTGAGKMTEGAEVGLNGADFVISKPLTMATLREVLTKVRARDAASKRERGTVRSGA